ncbi:hypothetical protein K466DRAFT_606765 [Polyporus arcularius HHB13444]|uniref:Uncharacterized protein n=1 Tax=Polyporus arcularius HHB13444 TaxID=1314778 RepID=A0A5C3NRT8_9APHY|nr:hypothetical protein K466DRAFT_606765 [Polyporus arcularius HHB13444]
MPQVDLRVQTAINERMPSVQQLKESLPPCTKGEPHEHKVVVEYGQTNWENVGLAVCECTGPPEDRCENHNKVLECQMNDAQRLDLLAVLKELTPPPYRRAVYWADLVYWHALLENKLEASAFQDAPSCEVVALLYVQDKMEPLCVVGEGTRRGDVVHYTLGQGKVLTALDEWRNPVGHPLRFVRWQAGLGHWVHTHEDNVIKLAPCECVLYREVRVTDMPRLPYWQARVRAARSKAAGRTKRERTPEVVMPCKKAKRAGYRDVTEISDDETREYVEILD